MRCLLEGCAHSALSIRPSREEASDPLDGTATASDVSGEL
jgi:hypothetical protein